MRIDDIMTGEVLTVSPETPLKEAAQVLTQNRISGLPVLDPQGRVVGVLSETDILFKERLRSEEKGLLHRLLRNQDTRPREKLEAVTAGEAMTSPPITIYPGAPVSTVAERMLEAHVNRLVVVDDDGRLLGIVTRADLVRAFVRSDEEIEREIRQGLVWAIAEPGAVVDITVDKGVVQLSGTVNSKRDAESIPSYVERVPGVVKVVGQIGARTPSRE